MESALYDPETGYYPTRASKQDFYTAPELHPSFGWVIAREIVKRLAELKRLGIPGPYAVVEMGSGSGLLAKQILSTWEEEFPDWASSIRYILVERVRDKLLESVVSISPQSRRLLGYSKIDDLLPCTGVFFSNELVDSFPFHLLERRDGKIHEVYIDSEGRSHLGRLSVPQLKPVVDSLGESIPEGGRHAVNLEARQWIRTVASKIRRGYLMTIDYGKRFPIGPNTKIPRMAARHMAAYRPSDSVRIGKLAHISDRPANGSGTGRHSQNFFVSNPPRSFYRHTTGPELVADKGSRDLTASADFEVLIREGAKRGLKLESYETMSRFLIDGGIADWITKRISDSPFPGEVPSYKERAKIKTLIHPEGMGEAFKVLVQSKL